MNWVQINIRVNGDFRFLVERCTGIAEVMGSCACYVLSIESIIMVGIIYVF